MSTIKTEVSIEKCPLCGSESSLKSAKGFASLDGPMREGNNAGYVDYFWIKCTNKKCGCTFSASKSSEEAIALWNQRAA